MTIKKSVTSLIILAALAFSLAGGIIPAHAEESPYTESNELNIEIPEEDIPIEEDFSLETMIPDVLSTDDHNFSIESLDDIEKFVDRLYEHVLDRTYDLDGLTYWTNLLRNRQLTGGSVAHYFFFSKEFLGKEHSDSEFVNRLYWALMGRAPDETGRAFWENRLYLGWPREDIFSGFVNSIEFGIICSNAGILRGTYTPPPGAAIKIFITRLYRTTLDRDPDTAGLNYWFEILRTGRGTGASVAFNFVFSPEMIGYGLTNEEFVERLYESMMGRDFDDAGLAFWVGRLDAGWPREDIFASFVNSPEYDRICRNAGITRGSYTPPPGGLARVFVTRLYKFALENESPDLQELRNWQSVLSSGRETGASAAHAFIFNDYMNRRFPPDPHGWNGYNEEFVRVLYRALLGRVHPSPSDAEVNYMTDLLRNGVSRYTVFVMVVNSAEFERVCRDHGILRGTIPPPTNFLPGNTPLAKTWNFIRMANYNGVSDRPEHMAGIVGNMRAEAGYYLCPFQQGSTGAGLGLLQWSGDRRIALENFMWNNGISRVQYVTEMNKHLERGCSGQHEHYINGTLALFDRALEVQINFMFRELSSSERHYMEFINSPSNRTGVAGARAYSELFCGLFLRPGAGVGEINNLVDPGVRNALWESQFYGGHGVLNRSSFSNLNLRRDNADDIFLQFISTHS